MGRLTESSIINYKNKSVSVTAEIVVPPSEKASLLRWEVLLVGGASMPRVAS